MISLTDRARSASESHMAHVTRWWSLYSIDNSLRRLVHPPQRLFGPYVHPGDTALDIGCGLGVFSLGLARLVGPEGRVFSIDLSPGAVDRVARRAQRARLDDRLRTVQCRPDDLGLDALDVRADFALAFWMVHETPDARLFFRQVRRALKPAARLLVAEPIFHVPRRRFDALVADASAEGFQPLDAPAIRFSHARLFQPSA